MCFFYKNTRRKNWVYRKSRYGSFNYNSLLDVLKLSKIKNNNI